MVLLATAMLASLIAPEAITSLSYSSDGRYLGATTEGGEVRIYDADARNIIYKTTVDARMDSMAFSPDGRLIGAAGSYASAYVWRIDAGLQRLWTAKLQGGDGTGVAFAPDGRHVAFTTGATDHAHIFDVKSGDLERSLEVLGNGMEGVAYLPDGKTLVTGGQALMVWNLDKPGPTPSPRHPKGADAPFPEIIGWTRSISVDRAGKRILAGGVASSEDLGKPRSVVLVNPTTGKVVRTFATAGEEVHAVALSPDGAFAAAADSLNHVRVWRTEDGMLVRTYKVNAWNLEGLTFAPNSRHLAIGGRPDEIHVFEVTQS